RFPKVIEALYLNPHTRMSTTDRVLEFAVRNGLELHGLPAFKEAQAAILGIKEQPPEAIQGHAVPAPAPEPVAAAPAEQEPIEPGAWPDALSEEQLSELTEEQPE